MQRTLKFVKYLPEFDWHPTVVTVDAEAAAFPNTDVRMLKEVPEGIEVYTTNSWDPYTFYAKLLRREREDVVSVGFLSDQPSSWKESVAKWIRANIFIPDARVGWNHYAYRAAQKIIEEQQVDAIVTTGPPHSTHLLGRKLKRNFKIPWLADFRDPWTGIDYWAQLPLAPLAKFLHAKLEKSVFTEADALLVVSPSMLQTFKRETDTHCELIYNGYDEADFSKTVGDPKQKDTFVIAHIGNMNADRNPESLWAVLSTLYKSNRIERIKIKLIGNTDSSVTEAIRSHGLESIVKRVSYLAHEKAIDEMRSSSMLLLSINNVPSAKGIVTGKVFEYMASGKPILGIGPPDGDAASILNETASGIMVDYNDIDAIRRFIEDVYDAWTVGKPAFKPDSEKIKSYSRRKLTQQMVGVLNRIIQIPKA